jgi:hypothetical protein
MLLMVNGYCFVPPVLSTIQAQTCKKRTASRSLLSGLAGGGGTVSAPAPGSASLSTQSMQVRRTSFSSSSFTTNLHHLPCVASFAPYVERFPAVEGRLDAGKQRSLMALNACIEAALLVQLLAGAKLRAKQIVRGALKCEIALCD